MSDGDVVHELSRLKKELRAARGFEEALETAFDAIGFTEEVAREQQSKEKRKALKDNVWGMLDLSAREMRLVDSPLFQRLRGLRQLGFSQLTYPSAEHSRFTHGLGMAHVVTKMMAGIDRDRSDDNDAFAAIANDLDALKPLHRREILYSALLHGIGNMPFSRSCEAAMNGRSELFTLGGLAVAEVSSRVRLAVGRNVPLSVSLSVIIVLSRRFETFYERLDPDLARSPNSLLRVAGLIAGAQVSRECANIQDIVSAAAVDANKIDYLNRDAKACGISIGVDVSRLFLGGGLIRAKRSSYDDTFDGFDDGLLYVVNAAGADTLAEISHARAQMYQRVYLHPLTRAAESLLGKALILNADEPTRRDPDLTDVLGVWGMGDAELLLRVRSHQLTSVASIGSNLIMRKLPKKACAFSGTLARTLLPLADQLSTVSRETEGALRKEIGGTFLESLMTEGVTSGIDDLGDRIREEAQRLADLLSSGGEEVPADELGRIVVTGIATSDTGRADALVLQHGEVVRIPAIAAPSRRDGAYDIFKSVGHVMCAPPWRQIVFQAARTVIHRQSSDGSHGSAPRRISRDLPEMRVHRHTLLDFDAAASRSNLDLDEARALAAAAADSGYYDEVPLLAPRTSAKIGDVLRAAETYRAYDGEGGWRIRPSTVAAFTDQLPPRLRKQMLEILAQGTQLDQAATTRLLKVALDAAVEHGFNEAWLVPLSSSSGGPILATLQPRLDARHKVVLTLGEALSRPERPILLVDDNAVSGTQSAAQLHSYSGSPREEWPPELRKEERLWPALEPDGWNELKGRRWGIMVAVGAEDAQTRLRRTAAFLGLSGFSGLFVGAPLTSGLVWPLELKAFLEDVGRDLLAQRRHGVPYAELGEGLDKEACDNHCFGYGNHGGITATNANVPASTVTALWQPGIRNGVPWIPLFIRRGRLGELILA